MQIPLWFYLTSILLAFSFQNMASLVLKRGFFSPSLPTHFLTTNIKPLLPLSLTRNLPQFLLQPKTAPTTSARPFTTSSTAMSSESFLSTIKNRRTYYALKKESPISDSAIQDIIAQTVLHVPSSFNSQSTRIILLVKAEHDALWDIVHSVLKGVVPAEQFGATEKKIAGFKAAYGTVLFFEDRATVTGMQERFAIYADKFPIWATQSGMPLLPPPLIFPLFSFLFLSFPFSSSLFLSLPLFPLRCLERDFSNFRTSGPC